MRRPAQRFGILVLALALVPAQFSAANAGVIPWLYDAVFGPVGHYGYGGYGYGGYGYGSYGSAYRYSYAGPQISYAMPAAPVYYGQSNCGPAGCSTPSYSVGYRPILAHPTYCSTGGCSTVLSAYRYSAGNCGTCSTATSSNSACAAKTAWKSESKEATTQWPTEVIKGETPVPSPAAKDDAPTPKTFATEPADPSKGQPVAVEKVVTNETGGTTGGGKSAPGDLNWTETGKPTAAVAEETPSATGAADAGFGEPLRDAEEDVNKIFAAPVQGAAEPVEGEAAPTTTPVLPEGLDGLPKTAPEESLDETLPLNLDQQSSWRFKVPVQRVAFRPGYGRATLARTTVSVEVDYVVPASSTLRMVSR